MTNPWADLPNTPPYVLPIDRASIDEFNWKASDAHRIRPEIVPELYLGNPFAPVMLLNLNPGLVEGGKVVHFEAPFNAAAHANLLHQHESCPFYLLDPSLPCSPGREWWVKKLRRVIEAASLTAVAERVFVCEIDGYHSRRFSARLALPSQEYTAVLVRHAVQRGAEVIVMHGLRHWLRLVPELRSARGLTVVRNVQNPTISPGNVPTFDRVVAEIARLKRRPELRAWAARAASRYSLLIPIRRRMMDPKPPSLDALIPVRLSGTEHLWQEGGELPLTVGDF